MRLDDLVTRIGSWSREDVEKTIDREDALRAARPVVPSSSQTLTRCPHCRAWGRLDVCGTCGLGR